MRKPRICIYAKTETHISCAVTAQLIGAFVFATRIVLFLSYLYPKFQASSFMLSLYSLVCVGPGYNPNCWFSQPLLSIAVRLTALIKVILVSRGS